MKKIFLIILIISCAISTFAQGQERDQDVKNASIMLIPEKSFCLNNGYKIDEMTPDYSKALLNNDVLNFITAVEGYLAEHGSQYEAENLQATLDDISNSEATTALLDLKSNDIDEIINNWTRATFHIYFSITKSSSGIYSIRLSAIDVANKKTLFGGNIQTYNVSDIKSDARNKEFLDSFIAALDRRYNDIVKNGRNCRIKFKLGNDCDLDFFSMVECDGESGQLNELIDSYIDDNVLSTGYSAEESTATSLTLKNVRIPIKAFVKKAFSKKKNRPMGIETLDFLKNLKPILNQVGLNAEIYPIGIAGALVILSNQY